MMFTMIAIERHISMGHGGPGRVVKAACLENQRSRVRPPPPADIQVSKKQNVTSSLICKVLILWVASVTERYQCSNFESGVWRAVSSHSS